MKGFVVLYRDDSLLPADPPLAFKCEAEDGDHAEEQCLNAYPGCAVLWIIEGTDVKVALADYYGNAVFGSETTMPFRYDGHGVNDADGRRICKVSVEQWETDPAGGVRRTREFENLSELFAAAPELAEALKECIEELYRLKQDQSAFTEEELTDMCLVDATVIDKARCALAKVPNLPVRKE